MIFAHLDQAQPSPAVPQGSKQKESNPPSRQSNVMVVMTPLVCASVCDIYDGLSPPSLSPARPPETSDTAACNDKN